MEIEVIPFQLRQDKFRFVKILANDKKAFEKGWDKKEYKYNNPGLLQHIKDGGNYGIICGYNNLLVIDFDDKKAQEKIEKLLPKTLTVKSAGKGLHHKYFYIDVVPPIIRIPDVMDIQGKGAYVVCAGSKIGDKEYMLEDGSPMAVMSQELLQDILKIYPPPVKKLKKTTNSVPDSDIEKIKQKITVSMLLSEFGFDISRNPTECILHASKNKQDLSFDDERGLWHCFGCNKGGDIINLYMERYGCSFLTAKKELAQRIGLKISKMVGGLKIDNYYDNVRVFHERQPFFYDNNKMFWFWNESEFKYKMSDETDAMNFIDKELSFGGSTVTSFIKNGYLEAFRRVGRNNTPKEPKKTWIQFKDMIVDIANGDEFKATPKYFFTNPVPWSLGKSEDTPEIDKLFREWIVKEGVQDESYIDTLYEITAYTTAPNQFLQRLFAFTGNGSNGKGIYLSLIAKFVGDDNVCATEMKILTKNNFESSALFKKQVCMMGEVDTYDMHNTNLLKTLTGEDLMRFEFKGKGTFTSKSGATCMIATNSLPITPDPSKGFYRRWQTVDFPNEFPITPHILDRVPDYEFNNLARKSVRLLQEMYKKGQITNEGDVSIRMQRYEDRANPLGKYIREHCEINDEGSVSLRIFYNEFNKFLKNNRLRPCSIRKVGKMVRGEEFDIQARQVWDSNKKAKMILGLNITKFIQDTATQDTKTTHNQLQNTIYEMDLKKGVFGSSVVFDDEEAKEDFGG